MIKEENYTTNKDIMPCPGDACPLRLTCRRFQVWLDREDEDGFEVYPQYRDGCFLYLQIEFYGQ